MAEACLANGIGATVELGPSSDAVCHLFGERPGGFVVSGPRAALDELALRIPLDVFGTVGGDGLSIAIAGETVSASLDDLRAAHAALAPLFP